MYELYVACLILLVSFTHTRGKSLETRTPEHQRSNTGTGGKYSIEASSSCTACGVGRYSLEGESCSDCAPGTASNLEVTDSCEMCPANTYSNNPASTICEACDEGHAAIPGSVSCIECQPGTIPTSSGVCEACPAARYAKAGSSSCESCGFTEMSGPGQAACDSQFSLSNFQADQAFFFYGFVLFLLALFVCMYV